MTEIFAPFLESLVWSITLFLVFFVLLGAAFARGRILQLALGLLRVLASLFYSPFVYLRRAVQGICRFSERGEADYAESEQYLLGKFFLTAQAAIVMLALGAAAAGCVAAWTAFLPPKALREHASETRKAIKERRSELEALTKKHRDEEREWVSIRDVEMRKARDPHEGEIRTAVLEKTSTESAVRSDEGATSHVGRLRGFIAKEGLQESEYAIGNMRRRMDQSLFAAPIDPASIPLLQRWIAAWEREAVAELRMRKLDEGDVRNRVQPGWRDRDEQKQSLARRMASLDEDLKRLEDQASFQFKGALAVLLVSLGTILAYLWVAGLLIESAALAVRVAEDVRKIREGRGGVERGM